MADIIDCIRLADKISDMHRLAKQLGGSDYESEIRPWRDIISAATKHHDCTPLAVVPRLVEELRQRGYGSDIDTLWLTAAAVDVSRGIA